MVKKSVIVLKSHKQTQEHMNALSLLWSSVFNYLDHDKYDKVVYDLLAVKNNKNLQGRIKKADFIIVLGGDGTLLESSKYIEKTPCILINSDPQTSVGSLAFGDISNYPLLRQILLKLNTLAYKNTELCQQVELINHSRIEIYENMNQIPYLALNEVYIGAPVRAYPAKYRITVPGRLQETQISCGIIVTTGTGSSALYNSEYRQKYHGEAIKPPFKSNDNRLSWIVISPYINKNIYDSKLLGGIIKHDSYMIFISLKDNQLICMDGNYTIDCPSGTKILVKLSDIHLCMCKKKN